MLAELTTPVMVPRGLTFDGTNWFRLFYLKELDGFDEQYLSTICKQNQNSYPFYMTIELLSRIVVLDSICWKQFCNSLPKLYPQSALSYPNIVPVDEENGKNCIFLDERLIIKREILKQLTVGDSTFLLLQFQRQMFGDLIQCDLLCPKCNKMISVEIPISKLISSSSPPPPSQKEYEVKIDDYLLKIRPLTWNPLENFIQNGVEDKGAVASFMIKVENNDNTAANSSFFHSFSSSFHPSPSPSSESHAYVKMLDYILNILKFCVISSEPALNIDISNNMDIVNKIMSAIEEIDSQSNILLNMKCPICADSFKTNFFIDDFILKEISFLQQQLDREINLLALYYHWSEKEILSLSFKRRKEYLQLIKETLTTNKEDIYERE